MADSTPVVLINKALVVYAHRQNVQMSMRLRLHLLVLIGFCAVVGILATWLSDEALTPRLETPFFQSESETLRYSPMPERSADFNDASHFGQRWAVKLTSLNFGRIADQLESSRALFSEGVFMRDYYTPLLESGAFSEIETNLLTITSASRGITRSDQYLSSKGIHFVVHVPIVQTVLGLSGEPTNRFATVRLTLIPVSRDVSIEGLLIDQLSISSR